MRTYFLILVCLSGCAPGPKETGFTPVLDRVKVRSLTVTANTIHDYLPSTGRVIEMRGTKIFNRGTGFADQIFVEQGDLVNRGDTLLIYESSDQLLQHELAVARHKRIRYDYRSEVLAFPKNGNDTISKALKYITGLEEATLEMELSKLRLTDLVVTAHKPGRLVDWKPVPHGYYQRGEVLGEIVSPDDLVIESYFLQNELGLFSPGLTAELVLPDQKRIKGKLKNIGSRIDEKGRIKAYWYPDPAQVILPGTTVKVLPLFRPRPGIIIPFQAVLDIDGETVSFTVENDTARWKTIETSWYSKDSVEVVSGLVPGDRIIISNLLMVHEGTPVIVKN